MPRASKRDEVLDKADELFERQGFAATGVNQITQEANVASMTLYNNFKDKDELIIASLKRRSDRLSANFQRALEKAGTDPVARILSIFDTIDHWIKSSMSSGKQFPGCTFVRAASEFGDISHPAHEIAAKHKQTIIGFFEENLEALGFDHAGEHAHRLHILFDGAIIQAQVLGDRNSALRAREMAKQLLDRI